MALRPGSHLAEVPEARPLAARAHRNRRRIGPAIHTLSQEERDRRAVRALVWEIERKVRAHDAWLLVEGAVPPGEPHPAIEPAHERLRNDLERLAHLQDLRIVIRDIRVQGDTAWVDYRVEGRPDPARGASDLTAGRFTMRRKNGGWALDANRFGEGLPDPK